jgi:hypothetical protein
MKNGLLTVLFALSAIFSAAQTAVYPQQEGFVDAHGVLIYYLTLGNGSPHLH